MSDKEVGEEPALPEDVQKKTDGRGVFQECGKIRGTRVQRINVPIQGRERGPRFGRFEQFVEKYRSNAFQQMATLFRVYLAIRRVKEIL